MKNYLLNKYISKEFLISFFLSFFFFFFIFLINQILVMLQHEEVKNLSVKIIFELILLSTPQFLTFTFPFSTLTAAAMVIGDLASKNEILAMRSLGLSLRMIYLPFFFMSLLTTAGTFFIASVVNPWASSQYKNVYAKVISDMPTMALKPNSVTTINFTTISVGDVQGENLENVRIFDISDSTQSKLVTAKTGKLKQQSENRYIYQLILDNPEIMFTNNDQTKQYSLATAESLTYSINMSSMLPNFGEPTSSQVTNKKLMEEISSELESERLMREKTKNNLNDYVQKLSSKISSLNNVTNSTAIGAYTDDLVSIYDRWKNESKKKNVSYRKLYYQTEYFKRLALSAACIILCLLAFPISFFKVKHGRLIGFAISMVISVIYWGLLFYAQLSGMTKIGLPVAFKLFVPNIIFAVVAALLLWRFNKS